MKVSKLLITHCLSLSKLQTLKFIYYNIYFSRIQADYIRCMWYHIKDAVLISLQTVHVCPKSHESDGKARR